MEGCSGLARWNATPGERSRGPSRGCVLWVNGCTGGLALVHSFLRRSECDCGAMNVCGGLWPSRKGRG